ncbi:NAD(P)-binding protein [Rhizodiscina lignyota]|uniref:NAD(P)-binding protein n=1 Tax=Rhizodiscina lignyota TaxID=1504668 RepID=A0A9P4IFZ0_9PEZI|nr:NAD(P)-binding protein [Rhizodiscina lignyota]
MATWVIVGASRGLGYEYLKTLSANPSNTVVGIARTPANVTKQLSTDGLTKVKMVQGDMDDYKSLNAAAEEVSKLVGGAVDYLIINGAYGGNNEEITMLSPTQLVGHEEQLRTEFNQAMSTNALGPLFATNAFLPLVRAGKAKKIVVISSGMADMDGMAMAGIAASVAYSASKAAVNLVVAKTALDLKPDGIAILALSPGLVTTSGSDEAYKWMTQAFKGYEPNFKGPITTEQSVKAQLKVIDNFTLEQTGQFLSHLGNKRWLSANGEGDGVAPGFE